MWRGVSVERGECGEGWMWTNGWVGTWVGGKWAGQGVFVA